MFEGVFEDLGIIDPKYLWQLMIDFEKIFFIVTRSSQ